jgi:putative membrane protein
VSAFFAFLHHVAAFVVFAALVIEFVTLKDALTLQSARRLVRADMVYGMAAGLLLVVGLLRVVYFEKGAAFYFGNPSFIAKLGLFIAVGLLSVYPTIRFLSWRAALKQGRLPAADPRVLRLLRAFVHGELAGVVLILLFAAMMARGIGY